MAFFSKIWQDVKHGKNLELYIAVALAILAVVFQLIGVGPDGLVLSLTLAVLAMLAVGLLVQRAQNDEIAARLGDLEVAKPTASAFFVPNDTNAILNLMRNASVVDMWGGTLRADVPLFEDSIKTGVSLGRQYRVLLMKPGGRAIETTGARWPLFNLADHESALEMNIRRLNALNHLGSPGKVEVRVIDDTHPYTMYAFDRQNDSGSILVRLLNLASGNDARPTFWIHRSVDRNWFDHFIRDFEDAWRRAEVTP